MLKASEEEMWAGSLLIPPVPVWVPFRGDSTVSPAPCLQAGQSHWDVPGATSWACPSALQAAMLQGYLHRRSEYFSGWAPTEARTCCRAVPTGSGRSFHCERAQFAPQSLSKVTGAVF